MGKNPVSIIIPCHRVIGADGKLCAVLTGDAKTPLQKTAAIELDQYGNLVKYDDYRLGVCERFEWIRLPDAEHKKD